MIVVNESDIGEPAFKPLVTFQGGEVVMNRAGHAGLVLDTTDDVGRLVWFHNGMIWWQPNDRDRLFRKVSAKVVINE